MEANGWVRLGYMLLSPELMLLRRPVAAAAAAAAAAADEEEEPTPLPLPPPPLDDSGPRRWLRNFSSRRHLARLLLNQTYKQTPKNIYFIN